MAYRPLFAFLFQTNGGEAMGGNHAGGPISAHPSERQMPHPMVGKGRSNGMVCQFFWLKSCVGILREIEYENALFARSERPPKTSGAPLGMFRVASGYVLHFDRACSEARKTMYRTSIRHVLWRSLSAAKRQKSHPLHKSLNTSLLGKHTENRVFVPNFSVMKNKRVDSNVVCRNNLNPNRHGRQGAHTMADNNT